MAGYQVQSSVEVQFAQKLAANDKVLRDRALRKLRKWIRLRSGSKNDFTDDDLLKIWKGLFYCMWMSDKPLIQEELAVKISDLINHFQTTESALLFVKNLFVTMGREWFGIDRLRLNKFQNLIREGVKAMFKYLSDRDWDLDVVNKFMNLLTKEVVKNHEKFKGFPLSLQLHLAELYLEEFVKIAQNEASDKVKLRVIEPYCKLLVYTNNTDLREQIIGKIFELIMKLSNVGINHNNEDQSENELTDTEKEESENETNEENDKMGEEEPPLKRKRKKGKSKIKKHSYRKMFLENEKKDVALPYIDFDYEGIADKLIKFSSNSKIRGSNKNRAQKLAKMFRILAKGDYPLVITMPEYDGSDLEESDLEEAFDKFREEIMDKEGKFGVTIKRKRKRRKVKKN